MESSLRTTVSAAVCVALWGALAAPAAAQGWSELAAVEIAVSGGDKVRVLAEIADDETERSQGLMWRTKLPDSAGMLFIYDRPQIASFWMRNTFIPLDMLFIAEDCRIVRIEENAEPRTLTPRLSGGPVVAVLETRGGWSADYGVAAGDCVTWAPAAAPAE